MGTETINRLLKEGGFAQLPDSDTRPEMYTYGGIIWPLHFIEPSTLRAMKTWCARSDDVFVVSYPKAGTTWTQEIVSAICHNGDIDKVNKTHTYFQVPFLEMTRFKSTMNIHVPPTHEIIDRIVSSPRTIKTHLPGHLLPPDILRQKSKIVYVARNPKDVAVSYYYFHKWIVSLPEYETWDEFFEDFMAGKVTHGPWLEHYLYYWSLRNEPNVLFIKFEEMKENLKAVVQKIAIFLGYDFDDDVLDRIVNHCSFVNMRTNPMTNPDTFYKMIRDATDRRNGNVPLEYNAAETKSSSFMRKGQVGNWKSHFTVAQNESMDSLIEEKLSPSGLTFNY